MMMIQMLLIIIMMVQIQIMMMLIEAPIGGNPSKVAVAISSIMNVMNIKLKLLVIKSRIKHLQ